MLVWAASAIGLRAAQNPKFTAEVKVVTVLATVRNKHGEVVRSLEQADFLLEEDGRPQQIRYFSRESGLPLTLGLLVDTSMSQRRVLGEERSASYRFLDQVLREDKDKAFVIRFDRDVELLKDLTSSRKDLETALADLETPGSERPRWGNRGGGPGGRVGLRGVGTALYDAVYLASDELMKKQSGRKAIIVLSDGVDYGSKTTIESAIESAHRADTLAYSILFADHEGFAPGGFGGPGWGGRRGRGGPTRQRPGNRPDGKKILERISKETGGSFYEVSKKEPVSKIYEKIEEEMRSQYSLGFTSDQAGAGPGFRRLRLTTRDKSLVVQAREGYYAS